MQVAACSEKSNRSAMKLTLNAALTDQSVRDPVSAQRLRARHPPIVGINYSVTAGITAQPFHAFFSNDWNHDEASHRIRPPEIKQRI